MKWEYYCDGSYFDMWAVRPIGDRDFNSQLLFHVINKDEAIELCHILDSKDIKKE